jgi:4-hydroxy-tetrahydrodipicolinate synthase
LHRNLFVEANPIPAKWALDRMGMIRDGIRLPLVSLSAGAHSTVLQAMRQAGIEVG